MITIFAFSDSHGVEINDTFISRMSESDLIFFTGDGLANILSNDRIPKDKLHAVRGNCDGRMNYAEEEIIQVENVKILITHGHLYSDNLDLIYGALEKGVDCVVYGHSHMFCDDTCDGIRLINIGSTANSPVNDIGYTYIIVNGKNIFAKFVKTG